MFLTEKFSEKLQDRKAIKNAQRRARVNQRLEALADKLPGKMEKHPKKDFSARIIGLENYDPKEFSGYKRLHEAAAAADVRIEAVRLYGQSQFVPPVWVSIHILPNKSYSASSDAGILAPKKPARVPSPGL